MAAILERSTGSELILLVHGLGCAKESFSGAWDSRALEAFSLIAPDLPGHGGSPVEPWGCRMEDYAAYLKSIVVARRWKKLHIVAHSMGGAAALLLDRFDDLSLSTFINIEGNLIADDCAILSRRAAESSFEIFLKDFKALKQKAGASSDAAVRCWADWIGRCDPQAYHAACKSLVAWSDSGKLLDRYKKLPCPKAYIFGERSKVPAVLEKLKGEICIEVAKSGHFIMQESPDVLYETIARVITGKAPKPASY